MDVQKTFAAIMMSGIVCGGCASYPFIDDSIAQLDANPAPVATRFNLPEVPQLPIAPQSSEMLAGSWDTGAWRLFCRDIEQAGTIYKHVDSYKGVSQNYSFNSDGCCHHLDVLQNGPIIWELRKHGKWSYDSGRLTVRSTKMELDTKNIFFKNKGISDWKSHVERDIDETVPYRVDWFAHDEIALTVEDEKQSHLTVENFDTYERLATRKSVKVDAYGVKTKREIKVAGTKDGRETGVVSETVYPPMHLKKITH